MKRKSLWQPKSTRLLLAEVKSDLVWTEDHQDPLLTLCYVDAGTDEISADANVRTASRSFRQTFDVPATERLVNCKLILPPFQAYNDPDLIIDYSCAYYTNRFTTQGWLYISENYVAFYSYLLGYETKLLVELRSIQDIRKEKSKRGVFSDAIKLIMKDRTEVNGK